jgi:hypothetical protein
MHERKQTLLYILIMLQTFCVHAMDVAKVLAVNLTGKEFLALFLSYRHVLEGGEEKANLEVRGEEGPTHGGVEEDEVLVVLDLHFLLLQSPPERAPVEAFIRMVQVLCIAWQLRHLHLLHH